MDYILGFLLGFFLKDIVNFIKRVSQEDWSNRNYYDRSYKWLDLDEEDLP